MDESKKTTKSSSAKSSKAKIAPKKTASAKPKQAKAKNANEEVALNKSEPESTRAANNALSEKVPAVEEKTETANKREALAASEVKTQAEDNNKVTSDDKAEGKKRSFAEAVAESRPAVEGEPEVSAAPKRKKTKGEIASLVASIVLMCILLPILLFNVILIISSVAHPDETPQFLGIKPLIVLSDSMAPMIKTNDLIFAKEIKDVNSLKVGDVISFREKDESGNLGAIVTHKIHAISKDDDGNVETITTTGINNIARDPSGEPIYSESGVIVTFTDTPITADQLVGIYAGRLPGFGGVIYWMQTVWGIVVCVGVPALALIVYELIKRNAMLKAERAANNNNENELEALRKRLQELENKK